ncbi:LysE family transporter, partial [Bacillus sp. SIMBA_008]|uniref:LysE family translocator n=1 Tax=Bacillus sp. SIMBA_008 TaxID=3085757 RepID=UPI00397C4047
MNPLAILAFWGVSALFVITPGADWAYAISAGLQRKVLPAVLGLLTGHLVATLIVAAGVGTLIMSIPGALTVLTLAGSLYLVWLGVSTLRH